MTVTQTSRPGYYRGEVGEFLSLPWPSDPVDVQRLVQNSLGPLVIDWAEWRTAEPGLLNDEGGQWRFTRGQTRFLFFCLFHAVCGACVAV